MRSIFAAALVLAMLAPLQPIAATDTFTVSAFDGFWEPNDISIEQGDSVQFLLAEGTHTWELADASDSCSLPCIRTFATEGTVDFRCGIHHSMTGVIHVGDPPVIAIASPGPGSTASGALHVEGTATHLSGIANVTVGFAGRAPVLASVSGGTWSAEVPTTNLANGAATLVATATSQGGLSSQASVALVVDNPLTLDMELVSAGAAAVGTITNNITFSIHNNGNDASPVTVLAEYFYHDSWRPIGTVSTGAIPLGATQDGFLTWRPAGPQVGAFEVRVTVDPAAALPDPDRADNVRVVTAGFVTTAVPGIVVLEPV